MLHFVAFPADEHADRHPVDGDLVTAVRDVGAEETILDPCRTTGRVEECDARTAIARSHGTFGKSAATAALRDAGDSGGPPNRSQRSG